MIDNSDDPMVTVADDNAGLRTTMIDRLWQVGIEAGAFDSRPIALPRVANDWPTRANIAIVTLVSLISLTARLDVLRSHRRARVLLAWAQVLFLVSIAGLGASLWPQAVPGAVSFWQAASMNRTHVIFGNSSSMTVPLLMLYGYLVSRGEAVPSVWIWARRKRNIFEKSAGK